MKRMVIGLLAFVVATTLIGGTAMAKKGSVGLRFDMSPWGKMKIEGGGSSQSNDMAFTPGFGVFGEYRVLKYLAIGGEFMFLLPKVDESGAKRDKMWEIMPYLKGLYEINKTFTPYVLLEFGFAQYLIKDKSSIVNNPLEIPIGGGVGCEFNFGSFGFFVDADYLYYIGVNNLNNTGAGPTVKSKQQSLGINFGAQYNF